MATAAQILNLANGSGNNEYNLGLGYDSGHTDITPSTLYGGFSDAYYFFPKPDNSAVVFRMKVTGGRTSSNTKYPRCELREMDVSNTGSNDPKASWNGGSGTHWMRGKTKIVHTTAMKPWICFAQIHNGGSDVIRLQTEGTSSSNLKLVARHTPPGGSEIVTTIQSSYTVGTVIDWRIECINGTIKVYLGGVLKYTGDGDYTGCYFKAGLYLQSSVNNVNNTEGGDTSQYAEIELYDFMTWHTGQPSPAATYYEVNGGGGGGSSVPTSVSAGADASVNLGDTFSRTATEAGTETITSRSWTVQSAPAESGSGGQASVPVGQTTTFVEDFELGNFSRWNSVQNHYYDGSASSYDLSTAYSQTIVAAGPDHPTAMRTEVRDGDTAVGSDERAELSGFGKSWATDTDEGAERWYEFDVKFGEGGTFSPTWSGGSNDWLIFAQWHQVDDPGAPALALSVHNDGKVYFEREPDDTPTTDTYVWTVRPDVWEKVIIHVKWSPDSGVGFIHAYVNGVEVVPKTFCQTQYTSDTHDYYFKCGTYRRNTVNGTTVVFHDNIRISAPPATTGSSIDNTQAAHRQGWGNPLAVSDEFNYGSAGSPAVPDATKWSLYNGTGHDGNGTRDSARCRVVGDKLVITGQAGGSTGGMAHKFDQQYGKWECRARSYPEDTSNGNDYHPVLIIWPESEQWPEDGEYDFSENGIPGDNKYQAYIHFPHDADVSVQQRQFQKLGVDLTLWHNFAIEWTSSYIRGYFDGEQVFETSGGANSSRRDIQTMPSGHLTIQLDNFDGTDQTPAKFEVDWARIYPLVPQGTGSGSGGTARGLGVGGIPTATAGANVTLATSDTTSALNISTGGSAGNPKIWDGQGHTVGRINITADYVVVQNYRVVANSQYAVSLDTANHVTIQNCDLKGLTPTGDGDLNVITGLESSNVDILYNTVINPVDGDPGDSHTDFIQTWISTSHPTPSDDWRVIGNKVIGPANPDRLNSIGSIHQIIMVESAGRGGNSGGSGTPTGWLISDNEFGDSWNQAVKLDFGDDFIFTRNRFVGSSDYVFDLGGTGNIVYSDNEFGAGYGSINATVASGAGPAIPSDITGTETTTSIVGTEIGTAAALSWEPPALGAYTLRYTVTTAQGTFFDDVVVNCVTTGGGGGDPVTFNFGKETDGASSSASSTVKMAASKFTSTGDGVLKSGHARLWLSATGSADAKLSVYADSSGAPGAQLAESDVLAITNTTEAVKDFTFSGAEQIDIVDGTDYWLAAAWNDPGTPSMNISRDGTASARQEVQGFTWPTLPDPYGTPTAQSGPMDIWVTVEEPTAPGSTPGAAPEFGSIVSAKSGTSASILLDGSTATNGQMDAIIILSAGSETMVSVPAGWELMDMIQGAGPTGAPGGPYTGWVYYNLTGNSGAASFTKSGTRFWHAVRVVWTGVHVLGQHQVRAEASGSGGLSHTTPPVSTNNPNSMVVGICMQDLQIDDPGPYTPPPTWTERYDVTKFAVDEREAITIADVVLESPGGISGAFGGARSDEAILFSFVLEAPPPTGGGGGDPGGGDPGTGGEDGAPTISAGADETVEVNTDFFRVATEEDNGAAIVERSWSIVSGPTQVGATMSNTATVTWQFTVAGVYVLAYRARNSLGTTIDTVTITVTGVGGGQLAWPRTNGWFALQR